MADWNPFGHPFPHHKPKNVRLTPIGRLTRRTKWMKKHLIDSGDLRNFSISRAVELKAWLEGPGTYLRGYWQLEEPADG